MMMILLHLCSFLYILQRYNHGGGIQNANLMGICQVAAAVFGLVDGY
jgi:hypothetical protein